MQDPIERPSYEDVIQYYLREDVSEFLWQLARRRQLKFFHHCDTDPRGPQRPRPRAIALHCVENVDVLRERIVRAATPVPSYPYPFFPFFGIQSSAVNAPDDPQELLGWDLRFEYDYEWPHAFTVLLPLVALLQHFHVPVLSKYSGHRSLHLIVPAEAFPLSMKRRPEHRQWMATLDTLGDLFCRFAPYVLPTAVGLGKELVLTAPYSFHRYNDAISLPLSLQQAMDVDTMGASLDAFPGITWHFPEPYGSGEGIASLLEVAERSKREPEVVLQVAEEILAGPEWQRFAGRTTPAGVSQDSTLAALMAGAAGASQPLARRSERPEVAGRIRRALLAVDAPENKTMKYGGLVGGAAQHFDWELAVRHRQTRCEALAVWAGEGVGAALHHLAAVATDEQFTAPAMLAVRLLSFFPERPDEVVRALSAAWDARESCPKPVQLFLALSLAEVSSAEPDALDVLYVAGHTARLDALKAHLSQEPAWRAEERPDLALAALALVFSEGLLSECPEGMEDRTRGAVLSGVFGGKTSKMAYAARRARRLADTGAAEAQARPVSADVDEPHG